MSKLVKGVRPYLYFAYGSNLNVEQMAHRCPRAEPVCRYSISGLKLAFKGVADVVEDEDSVVHGALWKITDECERALNKYEGYRVDQSGLYVKQHFRTDDGKNIMLYSMNPRRKINLQPPSPYYLEIIAQGYEDFSLNTRLLFDAVERSIRAADERSRLAKNALSEYARRDREAIRKIARRQAKNSASVEASSR